MSWRNVQFSDLVEIQPSVKLRKGEEYSFVPMEDVTPNYKFISANRKRMYGGGGAQFIEGDTLFARITPCLEHGKISKVNNLETEAGFGSTEFYVIRAKKGIADPDFIFYLSRSDQVKLPAIKSMVGSSGRQRARKDVISGLTLSAPDIFIQQNISSVLNKYDDLIENNKRRIELLEESARQLYKEWFVRFRFPGHEHIKIIDGVPEGWESCPASEALHINPRMSVEKGKEIVCVPMASLSESQMTVDKSAFEQRTNHTSVKFMGGDTLFARITPCLENGKTAFVYFLEEGEIACGSTEFVVLRGKRVSNQFTYLLAREKSFRGNAIKSMIGSSGRQRVQPSCFDKYIVPIAPDYIQEQFDNMVSSAFEQIAGLAKQNEQLARARDILLPKLMSGEIAV